MEKLNVLHFAKTFNSDDFVDVVLRFADSEKFAMHAAVYNTLDNPKLPINTASFPLYSIDIQHGYRTLFIGAWRLSKILRKHNIQILHTHHYYESIIGFLACKIFLSCKHIVGRHYHNEFYITAKGLKLFYYLKMEALVNRSARFIVSPSSMITTLLKEQGVDPRKIHQIPYGFDFTAPKFSPASRETIETTREDIGLTGYYGIGNFGRHHKIKGQLVLLESLKRLTAMGLPMKLVLVGDGPFRPTIEKYVVENELAEHVIFLGWRTDVTKLICAMDVIVHPTFQEAFPQIMIESMALGMPLIISKVSGATDVLQHEVNGVLVNPGESTAIDAYLLKFFNEREWASQLGNVAQAHVKQHYDVHKIIKHYEAMYRLAVQR